MDIQQTISGHVYTVCCPDSWYLAKQITSEQHDEYCLEYEKIGNNAKIKHYRKKKTVDFYDKEHIIWVKSNTPSKPLGVLFWTNDELNKVILILKNGEEFYPGSVKEDCFYIFYDIYKHLREFDIIEIRAPGFNPKGQNIPMIYRASKDWIDKSGYTRVDNEFGPQCVVNKSIFEKCPDTKKIEAKPKKAGVVWMKKNKRK